MSNVLTLIMASYSKSPAKGVQYFQHFPKNFLRPYGAADPAPEDDKIFSRVTAFNCEWLIRPDVAISEFAATVSKNLDILRSMEHLMNVEEVQNITGAIQPFLRALESFDTKAETGRKSTQRDLMAVTEGLLGGNEAAETFFNDAVQLGGALFTLGIQYNISKALVNNPAKFADLSRNSDGADSAFKRDPSLREMMRYLQSTCLKADPKVVSSSNRNLLREFREIEREEASNFQEQTQTVTLTVEQSPRKKKDNTAKKRNYEREEEANFEDEPETFTSVVQQSPRKWKQKKKGKK